MKRNGLLLIFIVMALLLITNRPTAAHEEGEAWFIVPYFSGNLRLETDHFAAQWSTARELDISEQDMPETTIVGLNNATHIYFHIRWEDQNPSQNDGVALFFEGAGTNGEDDGWAWTSSRQPAVSYGVGVDADGTWKDGYWNVAFGRILAAPVEGTVDLKVGESKEGFIVIATWDGSSGGSFAQIDPEDFPHWNLYILPFIDYYPKDVFVLLPILGLGLAIFTYREIRLFRRPKK